MSSFKLITNFENASATLDHHAPKKSKVIICNLKPYVDKYISKARVKDLQLKTKTNKTKNLRTIKSNKN